jgi:hypothetical protein
MDVLTILDHLSSVLLQQEPEQFLMWPLAQIERQVTSSSLTISEKLSG